MVKEAKTITQQSSGRNNAEKVRSMCSTTLGAARSLWLREKSLSVGTRSEECAHRRNFIFSLVWWRSLAVEMVRVLVYSGKGLL